MISEFQLLLADGTVVPMTEHMHVEGEPPHQVTVVELSAVLEELKPGESIRFRYRETT